MPHTKFTDFTGHCFYVGLDVHKNSWTVTVRTSHLEVKHFTQPPDPYALYNYLGSQYPGAQFYSAYEAGFSGTSAHQVLCQLGIHNIIVHPADLPSTDKQQKNKTDLHDSRSLARYLESGLLSGIYIMDEQQQERRSLFRLRQQRVRDVTRCNNRLRSFLYYRGIELPATFANRQHLSKKVLMWLTSVPMHSPAGRQTLQHYIAELLYQRTQLHELTKTLREAFAQAYQQQYQLLLTVPGFGPITTIALLAETGDLSRFNDPDQFASYVGLIPWERSSGEKIYAQRMQPRCNSHLRPILIEAAWSAIRHSPRMLLYYKAHAHKHGNKAIVKVARKLLLIAKAVAVNQQPYEEQKVK